MNNTVNESPPFFSINYVRAHWKWFLAGVVLAVLLITAFFLILFLVILKPSSTVVVTTVSPGVTSTVALATISSNVAVTTLASTVPPIVTVPLTTVLPVVTGTVAQPTVATKPAVPSTVTTARPTVVPVTTVVGSTVTTVRPNPSSTVPTVASTVITVGASTNIAAISQSPAMSSTVPSSPGTILTTTGPTPDPNKICTSGFTLVNNKCWFLSPYTVYRDLGDNLCFNQAGSTLVSIRSADENDKLAQFVDGKGVDKIWLGVKCSTNDTSSCKWDYEQGNVDGYSNFAVGSPNVTIGTCVYYLVADKKWYSGICDSDNWRYAMFCELPSTSRDTCKNNWNNNCYIENGQALFFDDAQDYCRQQCGTLLSIHSALENRYISSIYQLYYESRGGYLIMGAMAPSQDMIIYSDHTPINTYNNLKNFTMDQNCVYYDIPSSNWFSGDCYSKRGWSLCKRPVGTNC